MARKQAGRTAAIGATLSHSPPGAAREFGYIAGIDLLRFLGALSVVALHLGSAAWFKGAGLTRFHVLVSGGTGVTLFYVISGFLITSLIADEVRATGRFAVGRFFIKRALRIFPLYYCALGCYLLAHLLGVQKTGAVSFAYALGYSYNFIPQRAYDGWLGSFHTLATEEHFYLFYPLLWLACLARRWPVWLPVAALILLTFVTPALCRPFRADYFIGRWTFNAWGPILIGCLFAFVHQAGKGQHEGRGYFLALFTLLFAIQALVANALLMSMAFGFLLLHLANNQARPLVAALGARPVRYLGSISYGIYVWQSFVLSTGPSRRLIDDPLLGVATVLLLAALSWHWLEKPLARLRRRL